MTNDATLRAFVMNDGHRPTFEVAADFACIGAEFVHDLLIEIIQVVRHEGQGIGDADRLTSERLTVCFLAMSID